MRQAYPGSSSFKNVKWWVVFGFLFGTCFFTYHNSLHNPFMLDDHQTFSDVKIKNPRFLLNTFIYPSQNSDHGEAFKGSGSYYRPMAYVISTLSYLAFGNEPYGYHVLNLFLFTLMCFILYVFIDLAFKDRVLAFVTSILFAVHPINVFYVNYITSGIHSVRFIFMFLSVIFFLKALEGAHKNIFYMVSLLSFGVSLLCHETSMVLPFYILFMSIFSSQKKVSEAAFKVWPYFMMFLLFLSFRFYCGRTHIIVYLPDHPDSLDPHRTILIIAAFSKLIYLYFTKLLFPDFILFFWSVLLIMKHAFIWIGALLILFAGWYVLLRKNEKGVPFFCATWMMLGFLPVTAASMSYPDFGLVVEPQWLTFSSVGFFLFIAWAGLRLYARVYKWVICLVFISLLIGWGMVTHYNNWIFADEIRYYDYWGIYINRGGKDLNLDNFAMGNIYLNKKDYYLARYYYRKVIQYGKPEALALAYNNLGLIDMGQGSLNKAHEDFVLSINNDPRNYFALNNLALVYLKQGNYGAAEPLLLRSLGFDKYALQTRLNLAFVYEKESNHKEAERIYKENLNIVPYEEHSLMALVQMYLRSNDVKNVENYSKMLIGHSHDPAVLTGLGSILAQSGQLTLASDAFSQAMRVGPRYKPVYLEAGKLLANARMYNEAISIWQMGESIDPKDQSFKDNINKAMTLKLNSHV